MQQVKFSTSDSCLSICSSACILEDDVGHKIVSVFKWNYESIQVGWIISRGWQFLIWWSLEMKLWGQTSRINKFVTCHGFRNTKRLPASHLLLKALWINIRVKPKYTHFRILIFRYDLIHYHIGILHLPKLERHDYAYQMTFSEFITEFDLIIANSMHLLSKTKFRAFQLLQTHKQTNTTCKGPGTTIFHSKDIASYNEDKCVTPMVY